MSKRHLFISGTGRAGTTFLVQLFTELGLDTGFSHANENVNPNSNAGMEWNIRNSNAPYIVKSPAGMTQELSELLATGEVTLDCAIIPIRDLYAAAESRRAVQRNSKERDLPGGLVLTENPEDQETALAVALHRLTHTLTQYDIPMIWLYFPRLVQDAPYLYRKLKPLLPHHDFESFSQAFRAVSRPELVHVFKPKTALEQPSAKGLRAWFRI